MDFTVGNMLIDIAIASAFIFIAKMMREKISILQKLFIPASLLAGFIGLSVGDNGLGLVHFSSQLGSYAGILIIVVFVTIGIRGFNFSKGGFKENLERIGYYYCFRNVGWAGQYTLPILLGLFVLPMFAKNLNPNFGMLIPAGFQGGHGTSAALGETLTALGWADATDLAMTTATVGLLTGIFGGILLINIATKKGYTSYVKDFGELPEEMKTGIIPEEKRESIIEIFALAFLPGLIASGKWYVGIIPLLIYGIVLFLLPIIGKFWYKGSKKAEERKNLI